MRGAEGGIPRRLFLEPAGPRRRWLPLVLALLLLTAALWYSAGAARPRPRPEYEIQLAAALRMERCMEAARAYKAARGLELNPLDYHRTGMLGAEWTGITTTSGSPEAKRTTAGSDMAALAVIMLHEAGVGPGDRVALGLSGSFPGMNLAVLCACAELGAEVTAIASVGASTYGANQPQLTFPELYLLLIRDGLLPGGLAAITWGGERDCGLDMDQTLRMEVAARLSALGREIHQEPDYARNLDWREALYREGGEPACFVSVGGNITSLGRDQASPPQGLILSTAALADRGEKNGMLERYHHRGVPVISYLGIRQLTAAYGLPFDPAEHTPPGRGSVYFVTAYPKAPILAALALAGLLVGLFAWNRRRP